MKFSLKQKLLLSLVSGLSFAILHSMIRLWLFDDEISWPVFIFQLLFFGLGFGFFYPLVLRRMTSRLMAKTVVALHEAEQLIREGPANLFRGVEAVGGKLVLTDQRLIFKPHKLNIQGAESSWQLADISEVETRKTAQLFQNGLRVFTKSGAYFDFVVYEREKWLEAIAN